MNAPSAPANHPRTIGQEGPWMPPASAAEGREAGRSLRRSLPRKALAVLGPRTRDPLEVLDSQNLTRVPELVPLREERMAASPLAFYRGSAAVMAADLALEPHTGVVVPSSGDAHVANFGFYASPQRTLVFDLDDFDEAAWAPWEWDLKRLVTSVVLAGRASGRAEAILHEAVTGAVRAYATALDAAGETAPLEKFYAHFDADAAGDALPSEARKALRTATSRARKRTGERAVRRLTEADADGRLRFVPDPPTMQRLDEAAERRTALWVHRYLDAASPEVRVLMQHYVVSDMIRRAVGIGSVGTRCSLILLQDGDGAGLIMQSKEAGRSVLEEYGRISQPRSLTDLIAARGEGARVVGMQRVLQAVSDPLLGHLQAQGLDLYVRQYHDMKGGIDAETLDDEPFTLYAQACALTLARAHGQSPLVPIVSGYLGGGGRVGEALWEWSNAYADRAEADHAAFAARRSGSA